MSKEILMSKQNTVEHYDISAGRYERRWRGYLDHTHQMLLGVLLNDLQENDSILDVSCGTGLLASQLIEKRASFQELVLNDISPRMLGIARNRLPNDPRISFTAWPAEDLQFEGNRFTKIICLNAFHNYEKPSLVLKKFKQLLTPNGKLYLLDWNRSGWFRFVNSFINWYSKAAINTLNLKEVSRLLKEQDYSIYIADQWNYRYWKFLLVVADFQPWRNSVV